MMQWVFSPSSKDIEFSLDSSLSNHAVHGTNQLMTSHDLYSVPYSKEYNSFLGKAAELLHEAGDLAGSTRYIDIFVANNSSVHIILNTIPFTDDC